MKERKLVVLAEIAIFAAIGFALDTLQGGYSRGLFTAGGSIGIAMLPVMIIAYRRGLIPGILCGLILSIIQMLTGPYFKSVWTIMFDYVLAYTVVGFTGVFAKSFINANSERKRILFLILGAVVGGGLKFVSQFISGLFWLSDGSDSFLGIANNTWVYSLVYNMAYCLPNIILCGIFLILVYKTIPNLFGVKRISEVKIDDEER